MSAFDEVNRKLAVLPVFSVSCTLPRLGMLLASIPGLVSFRASFPNANVCTPVGDSCVSQAARFWVKLERIRLETLKLVQVS